MNISAKIQNTTWDNMLGNMATALETLTDIDCTTNSTVDVVEAAIIKHIKSVGDEETFWNLGDDVSYSAYKLDISDAYYQAARQLLIDAQTIEQKKEATT